MNFRARYSEKLIFWGVYTLLNCGNNLKWTEDTSRNKVRGVSEIPSGGGGFHFLAHGLYHMWSGIQFRSSMLNVSCGYHLNDICASR